MEYFLTVLVSGIGIGCMYGFVGLSFASIFNCSKVVNFALGDLAMLGAYGSSLLVFSGIVPVPIGLIGAIALPVVAGLILNYGFVEPLLKRNRPMIMIVIGTMTVGMIFAALISKITDYRVFPTRLIFGSTPITWEMFRISPQYLAIIIAAIIVSILYYLFLKKTKVGLGVTVAGLDSDMASLIGVKLGTARLISWIIAGIMCGLVGFLLGPVVLPSGKMGTDILLYGFIAAVVGGFGNPVGAIIGGLILGCLISFTAAYISGGMVQLIVFTLLLIILAVKPTGLLKE